MSGLTSALRKALREKTVELLGVERGQRWKGAHADAKLGGEGSRFVGALVGVMYAACAADGAVTTDEIRAIHGLIEASLSDVIDASVIDPLIGEAKRTLEANGWESYLTTLARDITDGEQRTTLVVAVLAVVTAEGTPNRDEQKVVGDVSRVLTVTQQDMEDYMARAEHTAS